MLFFITGDNTDGWELWVSDGTEEGTEMLRDFYPSGPTDSPPTSLFAYNDKLYFSAHGDSNGKELWVSDGTEEGTMLMVDIALGSANSAPEDLLELNDNLFFTRIC